jgi:hypothetical protein
MVSYMVMKTGLVMISTTSLALILTIEVARVRL